MSPLEGGTTPPGGIQLPSGQNPWTGSFRSNLPEYLYVPGAFVFHGGGVRVLSISGPGNIFIKQFCPIGYRWILISAYLSVVCDATVANRNQKIGGYDASGELFGALFYGSTATAGQTKTLGIHPGPWNYAGAAGVGVSNVDAHHAIGELLVDGGESIQVSVSNGVAGDTQSGRIRVLEVRVS